MQQTLTLYAVDTAWLPDKINCHALTVDIPLGSIIASVDLVVENNKRKLRFWLIINGSRASTACDFYLVSKQKNTNCLKCPTDKKIIPLLQFNHPDYLLVCIANDSFDASQQLFLRGY